MANSHAKGKRIERQLRKHYEALGWVVHQAISTGTKRGGLFVSNTNDIYECIDLLMKHPEIEHTLWLQATTKNGMSARVKKIKEANIPWKDYDKVAVVAYYGAKDLKDNKKGAFYTFRWYHEDFKLVHDDEHRLYVRDMEK